jgi:simple sugar transport system substrate-binding protein
MTRRTVSIFLLMALLLVAILPSQAGAQDQRVFYWISHGTAGDPIWATAAQGAEKAGEDLGVEVRVSFHGGDVAAHKEAFLAAIAAGADGIATSSPEPSQLNDEVAQAMEAGIAVMFFNTDDPDSGRPGYVGAYLIEVGRQWAQYLVDNGLVESGDFVFMPVEVPGATYGVEETKGIASVFDPLGIEYEVVDAQYDPAQATVNMVDYLTANADKVDAMIGLGDLVTGNTQATFEQLGWEPGTIPVVGWGNSAQAATGVKNGYINAAMFQDPFMQGYMPIVLMNMGAQGFEYGYDVYTGYLYEADKADFFIELFGG